MQQANTGAKNMNTQESVEKAKQQLIEQAKKMEQAKKEYEQALEHTEAESPVGIGGAKEPEEKVYSFDQLQIAMCCETIQNLIEGLPQGSSVSLRLRQARLTLFYLGGMEEFLPEPEPRRGEQPKQVDEEFNPEEEFISGTEPIPDQEGAPSPDADKDLDEISAKLKAFEDKQVMKQPDIPKPEGMVDKILHRFVKKELPEREVSSEHQPISLG